MIAVEINGARLITQNDFSEVLGIFDYPIGTKFNGKYQVKHYMLDDIASLAIDGLGLLRSELMLLELLESQTLEQWLEENSPVSNY